MIKQVMISLLILVAGGVVYASDDCELTGSAYQWLADYCLLKLETDDLVAAQKCIDDESNISFQNECDQKLHYKLLMCRSATARKIYIESERMCVGDPNFMGHIVRKNGL